MILKVTVRLPSRSYPKLSENVYIWQFYHWLIIIFFLLKMVCRLASPCGRGLMIQFDTCRHMPCQKFLATPQTVCYMSWGYVAAVIEFILLTSYWNISSHGSMTPSVWCSSQRICRLTVHIQIPMTADLSGQQGSNWGVSRIFLRDSRSC